MYVSQAVNHTVGDKDQWSVVVETHQHNYSDAVQRSGWNLMSGADTWRAEH